MQLSDGVYMNKMFSENLIDFSGPCFIPLTTIDVVILRFRLTSSIPFRKLNKTSTGFCLCAVANTDVFDNIQSRGVCSTRIVGFSSGPASLLKSEKLLTRWFSYNTALFGAK